MRNLEHVVVGKSDQIFDRKPPWSDNSPYKIPEGKRIKITSLDRLNLCKIQ